MKHLDWRSFEREAQEAIRKIAVRAVDENSESPDGVIRILGITKSRLYDWLARYRKGGYEALNILRGRGEHPSLNKEQQIWIGEQTRSRRSGGVRGRVSGVLAANRYLRWTGRRESRGR